VPSLLPFHLRIEKDASALEAYKNQSQQILLKIRKIIKDGRRFGAERRFPTEILPESVSGHRRSFFLARRLLDF